MAVGGRVLPILGVTRTPGTPIPLKIDKKDAKMYKIAPGEVRTAENRLQGETHTPRPAILQNISMLKIRNNRIAEYL